MIHWTDPYWLHLRKDLNIQSSDMSDLFVCPINCLHIACLLYTFIPECSGYRATICYGVATGQGSKLTVYFCNLNIFNRSDGYHLR